MFPPVPQNMHRPHNPPPLQLPDRSTHIRPRHAQSLRNLLRRQSPRRQIQQRMNLRHRTVNPPPRPHLPPVQNVSLLHPSQSSHISIFSSIRTYRKNNRHVNKQPTVVIVIPNEKFVIPNEVRNLLPADATTAPMRKPAQPPDSH